MFALERFSFHNDKDNNGITEEIKEPFIKFYLNSIANTERTV